MLLPFAIRFNVKLVSNVDENALRHDVPESLQNRGGRLGEGSGLVHPPQV